MKMNMKKMTMICAVFAVFLVLPHGSARGVDANLPDDFPGNIVTVYDPCKVSEGYVFVSANIADPVTGIACYLMVLGNDGMPFWYEKLPNLSNDLKVLPNGYLVYADDTVRMNWGAWCNHTIRDENFNVVESISSGNGYKSEFHDITMLPNGNVLLMSYYILETDMRQFVDGGHPGAWLTGGFIQELDAERKVVFQWCSWDHFEFDDYSWPIHERNDQRDAVIHTFHLNTVNQDSDGHILTGTPDEIWKINRQTGEVMWTLGGFKNDFAVQGAGASVDHFGGHAIYRLPNGNVLFYDNADHPAIPGGDPNSLVHEYALDEENLIATHIWTYTPANYIPSWNSGNAQRLPNGNTFIGWGGFFINDFNFPVCTEVTPDGEVVFEMSFDPPPPQNPQRRSYRAFRFPYPPSSQALEITKFELATGNTYDFNDADVTTGVSMKVISGGGGYNECTVTREPYAPVYPTFPGKAPRVLPVRVHIDENGIFSMNVRIDFDITSFGFENPDDLTVYHRSTTGYGLFLPKTTTKMSTSLRITMDWTSPGGDMGEFIFCYDDLADIAYPPILHRPESDRASIPLVVPWKADPCVVYTVNQERDILLSFSPKGLARWYFIEVATDANFTNLVVSTEASWMSECRFIWGSGATNPPEPNTTYYWRACIYNANDEYGDWAAGSFRTVPPSIEVHAPTANELVQNGSDYLIQWSDNIAEEIVIELYKGETMVDTIKAAEDPAVVPGWSTFDWEVLGYEPGCDYSIKISSSADPTLYDFGEIFRIDIPVGDFDCDCLVQFDDFALLAVEWLEEAGGLIADLDGSGKVDGKDLETFVGNWMKSCP
jgi:hypothetical protein